MFEEYLAGIAGLIRDVQAEGRIRSGLDPNTPALMFLGLVQPAAILWVMSDGAFDVVRHAEDAWRLFSSLIAEPAPPRRMRDGRSQSRGGSRSRRGRGASDADHGPRSTQRRTPNAERRGESAPGGVDET